MEPYAGGAGVALRLLFDEYVDEVVLNDLNPGIAAFWRALFERGDDLIDLVQSTDPTVDEWHHQRLVYEQSDADDLERGFATFFLNRTNRSGILNARPIGGLDQTGSWKIDARFDKHRLVERVRLLSQYASRVTICEEDGLTIVGRYLTDPDVFIYADPPYLGQGDDLYLDTMTWRSHEELAQELCGSETGWFLTYDADARIIDDLYPKMRCALFQTSHTAAAQHVGTEYAIFAAGLRVESLRGLGSGAATWLVP